MSEFAVLTAAQIRALAHVRARAEGARHDARAQIEALLAHSGQGASSVDHLLERLRNGAAITLNFHPDRLLADGRSVAEHLLDGCTYRNQFETKISNGSRTAFGGGDRDRWEEKLFGGAYQHPGVREGDRPKYGALDLMRHPDGGSPRFGSCYIELRGHATERCTLTWGDSHQDPEHAGTIDVFEPLLAALLHQAGTGGAVLGVRGLDVPAVLRVVSSLDRESGRDLKSAPFGRALDDYIEAQVHGTIDLSTDVEALVIDPAFDETATGRLLEAVCRKHGMSLRRHAGFVLDIGEVPSDFRGPRMVPLAERVDREFATIPGRLDAVVIGEAAASVHREPDRWRDWADHDETLQHIKQLWHVLVRFGRARG